MTEVQAALSAPVPSGIEQAAKKVEAAMAAFYQADDAHKEAMSLGLPRLLSEAIDKAERELTNAVVMREVADRIGGDGPSDEDIAVLERAVNVARANLSSSDVRKEAYRKAADERREALAEVRQEMWEIVSGWVGASFEAADHQIAEGVRLISEAQSAAEKLDTWQRRSFPDFRFGSVVGGGDWHRGGEAEVEPSSDILRAVHVWKRADIAINRR